MLKQNVDLNNQTILVTGAAGFIGCNLVLELLRSYQNIHIVGIDNMNDYYDVSIKEYRLSEIEKAVSDLYGGWESFPEDSKPFIENALKHGDFENVYRSVKNDELESKDILIDFEKEYPKVAKESNINDILKTLKAKKNSD